MSPRKIHPRTLLTAALSILLLYAVPAAADVVGTLSAGTDFAITAIQAALALFILVLALTVGSGGIGVGRVVLILGCLAAAVSARTIAAMIQ